jgi:hypothetical protein
MDAIMSLIDLRVYELSGVEPGQIYQGILDHMVNNEGLDPQEYEGSDLFELMLYRLVLEYEDTLLDYLVTIGCGHEKFVLERTVEQAAELREFIRLPAKAA